MSRRTLADYIRDAFLARDKATVAEIIRDAEEAAEHAEPDGDEGKQAIVIHNHHNTGDDDDDDDKKTDDWKKSVDAGMKEIRAAIKKISDAMGSRDADNPFAKKDDDEGDGDGDDEEKSDDDGEEKKDEDETKDEELTMGEGALTGSPPGSAEPDLMEADPSLKTGKSMMGDSAYASRVNTAMNNVIRDTRARAEILAPGIKIGVLDGAMGPDRMKQAGARLCATRRQALTAAVKTERGMVAVGRHTSDAIAGMSCDAVRMLFIDASDRMRAINNSVNMPSPQFGITRRAVNDSLKNRIETINKRNADFWAANGGVGRRVG